MEHELIGWLSSGDGLVVHVTTFVLIMLGAIGLPIPEDIPILLAGAAASNGIVRTEPIFLTCYLSILLADLIIFTIGFFLGERLLTAGVDSRFFSWITEAKVEKARENLRKRSMVYIFIARHLFAIRAVTFIVAGALRVPVMEFLLADAVAALVSVSLVLFIGYYLGSTLTPDRIEHIVNQGHLYIVGLLLIVLLVYAFGRMSKKNPTEISE